MRFYNRKNELTQLEAIRQRSLSQHSQMTVITGRRRIGKTKLILKSCEGTATVYWFVGRGNEAALCRQFAVTASSSLNVFIPEGIMSFPVLFEYMMNIGKNMQFNLVIDEFQEFFNIAPSVYSSIQDIWDRYKDSTKVNLIASGSVYSLMHRVFFEYSEPLYGRCDTIIRLKPFSLKTLKEIMSDCHPAYSNDDLLALYTITGGVPKYVELLMDRSAFTVEKMIECCMEENSIFLEEGNILLVGEFGKRYGNYYSILSAIAYGRNTASEISQTIGDASVGGMLSRLEEDYELISKKRPVGSKPGSQNVRYEISDNFLRFWFRYVARNQDLVQAGLYGKLEETVKADYPTYSGLTLERYFRQKLREEGIYREIGSWWDNSKGKDVDQNEIDIVAVEASGQRVLMAEVKRRRKNFKPESFAEKVDRLRNRLFPKAEIMTAVYTVDDM